MNHRWTVKRRSRAFVATLAVGLLALSGCATSPIAPESSPQQRAETGETNPIELETMEWLNELQMSLYGDPNLGAVAIDDSRATVTVTWYGETNALLDELISRAPAGVDVVVHPADFRPAELQALIAHVMVPGAVRGVQITMGGIRNDGSRMDFAVAELPAGLDEDGVAALIADAIQRPDVPITVRVGAIVPAAG